MCLSTASLATSRRKKSGGKKRKRRRSVERSWNHKNRAMETSLVQLLSEAGSPRTRNERPTTPSLMRTRARQDFELARQGRLLYTMPAQRPATDNFLITPCLRDRGTRYDDATYPALSPTINFAWYGHALFYTHIGNQKFWTKAVNEKERERERERERKIQEPSDNIRENK